MLSGMRHILALCPVLCHMMANAMAASKTASVVIDTKGLMRKERSAPEANDAAGSASGLQKDLQKFLTVASSLGDASVTSEGDMHLLNLPEWQLQPPLFAKDSSKEAWQRMPMPFWEEKDVTVVNGSFKGRGYQVRMLVDRNVILPSLADVDKRCNGGRWEGGTSTFTFPNEHFVDAAAVDEPNAKVLIAARPAGNLWAHWFDNTYLKLGWLYPLMEKDLEHWTVFDTHNHQGAAQRGVDQLISMLKMKDQSFDDMKPDHSVGSLMTVCDMPSPHPFTMHGARSAALLASGAPDLSVEELKSRNECQVAYMQRGGQYTTNGRQVPNEDAIFNMIQLHVGTIAASRGFSTEVLRFSYNPDQPFQEVVKLLGKACVFVGAHGSSLHHTTWGPRGSSLVELFPEEYVGGEGFAGSLSFNVFWSMASGLGMKYGFGLYSTSQGADLNEVQSLLDQTM